MPLKPTHWTFNHFTSQKKNRCGISHSDLQLLATVIAMKEHMGWKISVRGKEICWSQDFIVGKTATQIRWPSSRRQKKDMQKWFSFLLDTRYNLYAVYQGLAWMCFARMARASMFSTLTDHTNGTSTQMILPFCGLFTHPQRALDTDAQSW